MISPSPPDLAPLPDGERHTTLDVLRGVALFGVLWVNLLADFRVSLFTHALTFHTHPGWLNEWIDLLTAWLIEFKAITVFSFLFGVGIGVQAERTASRGGVTSRFLLRRFAVLLGLGLCHMFLIWDGDILCLYAICGILMIPMVRLPAGLLVVLGTAAVVLTFAPFTGVLIPSEEAMRKHAAIASRIYAQGTFGQIFELRWREIWSFIVPLLINTFPKTLGLMMLGIAAWRSEVLKKTAQHRVFLATSFVGLTALGATATTLIFISAASQKAAPLPSMLLEVLSYVPLGLGMTAGLAFWLSWLRTGRMVRLFAAAGQMALTHYLTQSILFSLVFYGFGLGLFGKLAPAPTAVMAIAVFAVQLVLSRAWLQHYRFGPAEWLWRSLTYGRFQPMKRNG
jgi:uncharacterized protein